jgi:transcription elongation GreA/GreB family factor
MELLQADQAVKRPADKCKASFGRTVTLRRHDGREQSFKILSEDEADPSRGTVSPMYRRSPGPF